MRIVVLVLLPALLATAGRADTISGHVRNGGGAGIPDVDLDVFDEATGAKLNTPNDSTGVGGDFSVVVPPGTYRVAFDPSAAPGPTLAPGQVLGVVVVGSADLGDVVLEDGVVVTGRVVRPGAIGVGNADLDLVDASSGVKIFTPGDDTDPLGYFSFVTGPGTYFVRVQPPVASRLVASEFGPVAVAGATDLGTLSVEPGFWLSGRVTSSSGAPIAGVDVDAAIAGTGVLVPLVDDVTASDGRYTVVVPAGSFDCAFAPPAGAPYAAVEVAGFAVAGDATLDTVLPPAGTDPFPTELALGNRFAGAFASVGEVDEVRFDAVASLLVSLDARRTAGAAAPDFALLAPSGALVPLGATAGAAGVKARNVPLPESGSYRLLLLASNGGTGSYALATKFKAPPVLKKVLATGTVPSPGATVDIPVPVLAGATLSGRVSSGGSGLEPEVSLLSPGGNPVSLDGFLNSDPAAGVSISPVPLPETGVYALRIGGASGTTGTYAASLKIKFPRPSPVVVPED